MTTEEKNELYNAAQVIVALKYPKMPRKQALAFAGQLADKLPHLCRQYIERAAELDQLSSPDNDGLWHAADRHY